MDNLLCLIIEYGPTVASWTITLVTAFALWKQIKLMRKQLDNAQEAMEQTNDLLEQNKEFNHQQHESQRRNNSIEAMYKFINDTDIKDCIAKRVVEQFDDNQVRSLQRGEAGISITHDQYEMLKIVFDGYNFNRNISEVCDNREDIKECEKNKKQCDDCPVKERVKLTYQEVLILRYHVTKYLNLLEVILLNCKNGCGDPDAFFEQFKYQYNTRDGIMALKKFRVAAGSIESYPAIEWFCAKLEEKERKLILEKEKVDS